MKISTKGRYALRVMLDLAQYNTGEFIPLKEIAERQGITIKYLEQIMSVLSKSGFVKSARGSGGGYKLAAPAGSYKVGGILRAAEGNIALIACLDDAENQCQRSGVCKTLPFWRNLNNIINEYIDSVTLEDLLHQQSGEHNFSI